MVGLGLGLGLTRLEFFHLSATYFLRGIQERIHLETVISFITCPGHMSAQISHSRFQLGWLSKNCDKNQNSCPSACMREFSSQFLDNQLKIDCSYSPPRTNSYMHVYSMKLNNG